ncbi:hypothetical protein MHBO_001419, partial [Bonamia ostreae]
MASEHLRSAERDMLDGKFNLATDHLQNFSSLTGMSVQKLDKGYFGGSKIKENTKYIRDTIQNYNTYTVRKYMGEASKRGLFQQIDRYAQLLDMANKASVTESASIEVSALLSKMTAKMKYMDSPKGISELDVAKFNDIERRHSDKKMIVDEDIERILLDYSSRIDAGKFVKNIAGGGAGALLSAIDLGADIISFASDKPRLEVTKYFMDKMGVDQNSWAYFGGELSTFAFGSSIFKALEAVKGGQSLAVALSAFDQVNPFATIFEKYLTASALYATGGAFGYATKKIVDNIDITQNRRDVAPSLGGALGMLVAHKSSLAENTGSTGRKMLFGSKPTDISTLEFPREGSKKTRFNVGEKEFSINKEGAPVEETGYKAKPSESSKTIDEGMIASEQAMEEIYNNEKAFNDIFNKTEGTGTPSEQISGDTISETTVKNIPGESFEGAYIERGTNGSGTIKDVNISNIGKGSENSSKYNRKLSSDGTLESLTRDKNDIADVMDQRAQKLVDDARQGIEQPIINSDLSISATDDAIFIRNADNIMSAIVNSIFSEGLPISELDALIAERGGTNLLARMLKSEDLNMRALGTSILDIVGGIALDPGTNGQFINEYISKEIQAFNNAFFDGVGIDFNEVDVTKIRDKGETGNTAWDFAQEVKSGVRERFSQPFADAETSIDTFASGNPEGIESELSNMRNIIENLNEKGRPKKGAKKADGTVSQEPTLYYERVLKELSSDYNLGVEAQFVVEELKDILTLDKPNNLPGYKDSIGSRLFKVRSMLSRAGRMYEQNSLKESQAMTGAFGQFKEIILNPMSEAIENIVDKSTTKEVKTEYDSAMTGYA